MKLFFATMLSFSIIITGCTTSIVSSDEVHKDMSTAAKYNVKLGLAYLQQNEIERSKQKFLLAFEEAPHLPEVWYGMAYFQEVTHNFDLADQYYKKAIALDPKKGEAHNNYGTFLCRQKKYEQAIKEFLLAVQDKNYLSSAAAYENSGLCALLIPDKKLAKMYFLRAIAYDSSRTVSKMEVNKLKKI